MPAARIETGPDSPDQRGGALRPAGAAGAQSSVRIRIHHGREPRDRRRPMGKIAAGRGDGARGLAIGGTLVRRWDGMRRFATLIVAGLLLSTLAQGSAGAPASTVRVGAVIPLTGRFAGGGAQVKAGYEIAVEDINARGGVRVGDQRLPLELTIVDDESDPTKTVSRLEALAGQGVVVFLGGFGSDLHAAAAAVAEKNKIPYCGVAFALHAIHQQGFKYLFSPFVKSPDIAIGIYKFLNASVPAEQRPRRVAIFAERTDWGREPQRLWTTRPTEDRYQIVLSEEYTGGTRGFSPVILPAKGARAQAGFLRP